MADYYNPFAQNYVKKTTLVDENGNKSTGYYDTAKQAYADLLANAQKQNAAAADKQIADIGDDAQRSGTGLWTAYQQQMRRAPQQLAALGITGGAAESSVIGAGNNYLQQIAELDRQRKQQENDIRMNQSSSDNSAYQTYMNNLLALDQYNQDYLLQERQLANQEQQLANQEKQRAMQEAMSYGDITGDYSLLTAYGYSPAQVELLQKAWQADNAKKYAAMSGGGGKPYTPEGTEDEEEDEESIVSQVIDLSKSKEYSQGEINSALQKMKDEKKISDAEYRAGINAAGAMARRLTNG